jgi:putative transposase
MWTNADRKKYEDDGRRYPTDLTDAEWNVIESLFKDYRTYTADLREVLNACFYLIKTGCQWRYLPKEFGPWQTVRTWYDRFRKDGVWDEMNSLLARLARELMGYAPEPSTGLVDSQSVASGPQAGERGVDGNKKIKGIKRHVLTCSFGFVLAVIVTAANVHDAAAVGALLQAASDLGWSIKRIKVDGVYIGQRANEAARNHNVDFEVTMKPANRVGKAFVPLPLRWRVEATLGTLTNRYRRLTRNLEASFKAAQDVVKIANIRRILRIFNRFDVATF